MKASEYIKALKKLIDEYGDLEVVCEDEIDPCKTVPACPDFTHRIKVATDRYGSFKTMNVFGSLPEKFR